MSAMIRRLRAGARWVLVVMTVLSGSAAGVVGLSTSASATVVVTPQTGTRGGATEVTFHVSDDRAPAFTTQVELLFPKATPLAEVTPMSVSDWAPKITMTTLDKPVQVGNGLSTTSVASAITWYRAPDVPVQPGAVAELRVSIGPLPNAEQIAFPIVQTYSDGAVVRWTDPPASAGQPPKNPAPVLKLVPAPPGTVPQAGHAGHLGHDAGQGSDAQGGAQADSSSGTSSSLNAVSIFLASGMVVIVVLAGWSLGARRLFRKPVPVAEQPAGVTGPKPSTD
jgi:uncharacterized protein YcnI